MSLPPAIHDMYPNMKQEEAEFFKPRSNGPYRGFLPRGMCPARKFNWGAIGDYLDRTKPEDSWVSSFTQLSATSCINGKDLAILIKSLNAAVSGRKQTQRTTWILRNHNVNEYILLKAGRVHGHQENYIHVKGTPWLSLDKALILRICWSAPYHHRNLDDNPDESRRLVVKLKTGTWAGHKFDVVGAGSVELDESWRDVTDEITKEGRAWKAAFRG